MNSKPSNNMLIKSNLTSFPSISKNINSGSSSNGNKFSIKKLKLELNQHSKEDTSKFKYFNDTTDDTNKTNKTLIFPNTSKTKKTISLFESNNMTKTNTLIKTNYDKDSNNTYSNNKNTNNNIIHKLKSVYDKYENKDREGIVFNKQNIEVFEKRLKENLGLADNNKSNYGSSHIHANAHNINVTKFNRNNPIDNKEYNNNDSKNNHNNDTIYSQDNTNKDSNYKTNYETLDSNYKSTYNNNANSGYNDSNFHGNNYNTINYHDYDSYQTSFVKNNIAVDVGTHTSDNRYLVSENGNSMLDESKIEDLINESKGNNSTVYDNNKHNHKNKRASKIIKFKPKILEDKLLNNPYINSIMKNRINHINSIYKKDFRIEDKINKKKDIWEKITKDKEKLIFSLRNNTIANTNTNTMINGIFKNKTVTKTKYKININTIIENEDQSKLGLKEKEISFNADKYENKDNKTNTTVKDYNNPKINDLNNKNSIDKCDKLDKSNTKNESENRLDTYPSTNRDADENCYTNFTNDSINNSNSNENNSLILLNNKDHTKIHSSTNNEINKDKTEFPKKLDNMQTNTESKKKLNQLLFPRPLEIAQLSSRIISYTNTNTNILKRSSVTEAIINNNKNYINKDNDDIDCNDAILSHNNLLSLSKKHQSVFQVRNNLFSNTNRYIGTNFNTNTHSNTHNNAKTNVDLLSILKVSSLPSKLNRNDKNLNTKSSNIIFNSANKLNQEKPKAKDYYSIDKNIVTPVTRSSLIMDAYKLKRELQLYNNNTINDSVEDNIEYIKQKAYNKLSIKSISNNNTIQESAIDKETDRKNIIKKIFSKSKKSNVSVKNSNKDLIDIKEDNIQTSNDVTNNTNRQIQTRNSFKINSNITDKQEINDMIKNETTSNENYSNIINNSDKPQNTRNQFTHKQTKLMSKLHLIKQQISQLEERAPSPTISIKPIVNYAPNAYKLTIHEVEKIHNLISQKYKLSKETENKNKAYQRKLRATVNNTLRQYFNLPCNSYLNKQYEYNQNVMSNLMFKENIEREALFHSEFKNYNNVNKFLLLFNKNIGNFYKERISLFELFAVCFNQGDLKLIKDDVDFFIDNSIRGINNEVIKQKPSLLERIKNEENVEKKVIDMRKIADEKKIKRSVFGEESWEKITEYDKLREDNKLKTAIVNKYIGGNNRDNNGNKRNKYSRNSRNISTQKHLSNDDNDNFDSSIDELSSVFSEASSIDLNNNKNKNKRNNKIKYNDDASNTSNSNRNIRNADDEYYLQHQSTLELLNNKSRLSNNSYNSNNSLVAAKHFNIDFENIINKFNRKDSSIREKKAFDNLINQISKSILVKKQIEANNSTNNTNTNSKILDIFNIKNIIDNASSNNNLKESLQNIKAKVKFSMSNTNINTSINNINSSTIKNKEGNQNLLSIPFIEELVKEYIDTNKENKIKLTTTQFFAEIESFIENRNRKMGVTITDNNKLNKVRFMNSSKSPGDNDYNTSKSKTKSKKDFLNHEYEILKIKHLRNRYLINDRNTSLLSSRTNNTAIFIKDLNKVNNNAIRINNIAEMNKKSNKSYTIKETNKCPSNTINKTINNTINTNINDTLNKQFLVNLKDLNLKKAEINQDYLFNYQRDIFNKYKEDFDYLVNKEIIKIRNKRNTKNTKIGKLRRNIHGVFKNCFNRRLKDYNENNFIKKRNNIMSSKMLIFINDKADHNSKNKSSRNVYNNKLNGYKRNSTTDSDALFNHNSNCISNVNGRNTKKQSKFGFKTFNAQVISEFNKADKFNQEKYDNDIIKLISYKSISEIIDNNALLSNLKYQIEKEYHNKYTLKEKESQLSINHKDSLFSLKNTIKEIDMKNNNNGNNSKNNANTSLINNSKNSNENRFFEKQLLVIMRNYLQTSKHKNSMNYVSEIEEANSHLYDMKTKIYNNYFRSVNKESIKQRFNHTMKKIYKEIKLRNKKRNTQHVIHNNIKKMISRKVKEESSDESDFSN